MLECPSCQQALPPAAHFCTRCGVRLSATTTTGPAATTDFLVSVIPDQPTQALTNVLPAGETLLRTASTAFFRQAPAAQSWQEQEKQAQLTSLEILEASADLVDPYAHLKSELAQQCMAITASMESLLPFVYENHRAENQALFASTLNGALPLEDPVWGRVAFVLGAYGNYMYRYSLSSVQKRQVWNALLWAVFYERCYRRKYLAQRCQQLLHFFQGCAEDEYFLTYALIDLERLSLYLEAGSLKKLQETLQQVPGLPADQLVRVSERLEVAQAKKALQMEQQQRSSVTLHKENQTLSSSGARSPGKSAERSSPPHKLVPGSLVPVEKPARTRSEAGTSSHKTPLPEVAPLAHELLRFLSDEQIQQFFVSLRSARLETINTLLNSVRRPLFTTLLQELDDGEGTLEYQAPRRPIRLGKKQADRFTEARRLLHSKRASEQLVGLRLFEQGARETTHPDYAALAREWMLYARALVQGSTRVVDDWESNLQRDEASWEEIWNLAVFYQQTCYPGESLRVLKPGLDELRSPISHLRLALCCALQILLEAKRSGPEQQIALTFLLAHLEQWPHPLSYLAWLLLAHEAQGPLHPRQQSQRLSAFQELIEHPLNLPDPQKELPEARIAALEEVLTEKVRCEEGWFLWINDYANRHSRKYQAWARLAETSERLNRLKFTEMALQHLVEIQYQHDFARYQEGTPPPRADYLRRNLEKLFEFYQRHNLTQEAKEAFSSCYPSLSHLWEAHEPANRRLILLTRQYMETLQLPETAELGSRQTRELSKTITTPLEYFKPGQRVGIFVDYENIAGFIPNERDAEEVGKALADYAAQFGEVVCQWAAASPQNISNLADVRAGLEAASFKVRFPRRELQFSQSKKNLADFALLECLSEAQADDHPDIYLIVSGDRDYYERVCSLLDAGHMVRLIAATDSPHLSLKYRELEQQRIRETQATGSEEGDFFIDRLEDILCSLVPLN